jgi:hypothetical protein
LKQLKPANFFPQGALSLFETEAFRPVEDYSLVAETNSSYQLWDTVGDGPLTQLRLSARTYFNVAHRAERTLAASLLPDLSPRNRIMARQTMP